MKIIFDLHHPAHFHLFKNLIKWLIENFHTVMIGIQDKDLLPQLLDNSNLKYTILSRPSSSPNNLSRFYQWIVHLTNMYLISRKFKPDLLIGSSPVINWVGRVFNAISWNLTEDNANIIKNYWRLSNPFLTTKIKPSCLEFERDKKTVFHSSYHELAYLHPNNFSPNVNVIYQYNLKKRNYVLVRFSELKAYHDIGMKGINSNLWNRIKDLCKGYKIITSKENEQSTQIEACDIHHVIAFAKIVISDSQTMTAEAAVLGVPSIRYNSFVGKISYLEELEHKYNLTYGFKPGYSDALILKAKKLINEKNIHKKWKKRRAIMLSDKIDFNQWMINCFLKEN